MEFEATQFDDSLLDPAPQDNNSPVEDEPVYQEDRHEDDNVDNTDDSVDNNIELNAYEQFLKSRGIRDGKTIVYEDEDTGETSEVNFTDLTTEEQLSILNELSDPGLTEEEAQTIAYLRQNNVTFQDVIEYYKDQAIREYIIATQNDNTVQYGVDEYSDDELYLADLKSRYVDMSEEELMAELESAKENEELFNKKAESIRNRFKAIEDEEIRIQQEQAKKQEAEYYNIFNQTLDQFNYVPMDYKDPTAGAMQIETSEKAEIWDYIFKKDAYGVSAFGRDLNDPNKVIEMA
jgi:L-rhamnose mutarotase